MYYIVLCLVYNLNRGEDEHPVADGPSARLQARDREHVLAIIPVADPQKQPQQNVFIPLCSSILNNLMEAAKDQ